MDRNINNSIENQVFKEYSEIAWVYLKSSNSKGANYDPYRNIGYIETMDNPLPVKVIVHPLSVNSLIVKELGLFQNGAIEFIVQKQDVELFKICKKVVYDEIEYTPFKEALGNRVTIQKKSFDFYKIILFRFGI